jgi:pimeloyl-ACP methyl ester carboxylesterase
MEVSGGAEPQTFFPNAAGNTIECVWHPPSRDAQPPLVLLHDGIGSVAMWRNFPAELAAATGCGVLVYSRRGTGWSSGIDAPLEVNYMHREALEVLPELLDGQGIENPVLIGQSDGASIAVIHAGAGGRPVRGLILEAPHLFVEDLTIVSIERAKREFLATGMKDRLGRYHRDPEQAFFAWNDVWLRPDFRDWNIEGYLSAITCPVLAIQGEDDEYGTLAQIDAVETGVGGRFERLILAHCGHTPHRDQAARVVSAMADFIASL